MESNKKKKYSFWDIVEGGGESLDFGLRLLFGIVFAFVGFGVVYGIGSKIFELIGLLSALFSLPFWFLLGFFWMEIKLITEILIRAFVKIFID